MFLDDLVEASVVELDELGEIMDVGNDIAQVFLQQHELFFTGSLLSRSSLIQPVDHVADLALTNSDSSRDLHGLNLLLSVHLLELRLELTHEAALVVFGPFSAWGLARACGAVVSWRACRRRHDRPARVLQVGLETVIVDVVPLVFTDDARPELLAELHDDEAWTDGGRAGGTGVPAAGRSPGSFSCLEVFNDQHWVKGLRGNQSHSRQREDRMFLFAAAISRKEGLPRSPKQKERNQWLWSYLMCALFPWRRGMNGMRKVGTMIRPRSVLCQCGRKQVRRSGMGRGPVGRGVVSDDSYG